ncbi:hypothetical protein F5X99DRAFT_373571 [Biscogniauxia marginata]|nr:hypothetical protein F5X99DRAFT_373571 [Biscogniauxia marginata]
MLNRTASRLLGALACSCILCSTGNLTKGSADCRYGSHMLDQWQWFLYRRGGLPIIVHDLRFLCDVNDRYFAYIIHEAIIFCAYTNPIPHYH